MKNPREIANMCDTGWLFVYRAIQRLNIVPVEIKGRKSYYDEFQIELIIDNLYHTGKVTHLVFESKMNYPEPLYSRKEFLELGHLKRKKL